MLSRSAYLVCCIIIILLFVVGCGHKATTSVPGVAAPAVSLAATLGSEQAAGPFQVTLSANPSTPKVGKVEFTARVVEKGQPVKNAKVKLNLEMPGMAGPSVELGSMDDHYMGSADISMSGEWKAKVEITAGDKKGTAEYAFTVAQ